jgi:hypothetical protein
MLGLDFLQLVFVLAIKRRKLPLPLFNIFLQGPILLLERPQLLLEILLLIGCMVPKFFQFFA